MNITFRKLKAQNPAYNLPHNYIWNDSVSFYNLRLESKVNDKFRTSDKFISWEWTGISIIQKYMRY